MPVLAGGQDEHGEDNLTKYCASGYSGGSASLIGNVWAWVQGALTRMEQWEER